jgi:signal transduction histidine kinase/ActR/RegA family two-component response regulator
MESVLNLLRETASAITLWRLDLTVFLAVAVGIAWRHTNLRRHESPDIPSPRRAHLLLTLVPLFGLGAAEGATHLMAGLPALKSLGLRALLLVSTGWLFHARLARARIRDKVAQLSAHAAGLAEELAQSRASAASADRSKQEFLSLVSHELCTPMTAIGGLTRALGEAELPPEAQSLVEHLAREEVRLAGLIDDLLDFVRLESGRLELRRAPFCPVEAARQALSGFAATAEAKHLELRLEAQFSAPLQLEGDEGRYRRFLAALLDNAVKFTAQGTVSVQLSWEEPQRLGGRGRLCISVEDTGPGIPSTQLDRLFHPFGTLNPAHNREYRGCGLGLAVSRRLVQLMGGTLTCESQPGKGSVFRAELPLPQAPVASAAPASIQGRGRILVVDDLEANRLVVCLGLRRCGFEAEAVASGEEALARLSCTPFDAVLLDIHMPGMGGYETCRRIRQMEGGGRRTPVIGLTASISRQTFGRCVDAGMDAQLQKPLDFARLCKLIADHQAENDALHQDRS